VQDTTAARPASRTAWLIDSADFWRLWFVGLIVFVVRWVETIAVGVFVYQHTGSPFIVAMMTMLRLLPMGLFGAFLGAIAERMERRTTLIIVVVSMVVTSLTLATLAHLHVLAVWHLGVASFINGIGWATDNPVRRVMIGEAVGPAQMGTAMSIDVGANNASRMVGPTIGGLLLASVGIGGVFTLSVALYAIAVVAACRVRYRNSFPPSTADSVIARIAEGLRLVRRDRRLIGTLTVTVIYNVFGWPFTSMVPVIGQDRLLLGPGGIGILASMDGVGAFVGAVLMAMLCRPHFYRHVYVGGVTLYMVMLTVFALVPIPSVASFALLFTGDAGLSVGTPRDAQPRAWRAVCVHRRGPGRLRGARMAGGRDRGALGDRRNRHHRADDDAAHTTLVAGDLIRRFDPGQRQTVAARRKEGYGKLHTGGLLVRRFTDRTCCRASLAR
jgi:MFS family permease